MVDLNNLEEINRLDPQDTLGSTEKLGQQMEAAWEQVQKVEVPQDYRDVSNIIFCGMGASIYGALVYKAISGENNRYPTEYVSDYHLPKYVNSNSLVVLTSASGTTEEVLSCAEEAKAKGAKMLVLTKGGPLGGFARQNNVPAYIYDGVLNPSGVPRLAIGYSIVGLLGLLSQAGICDVTDQDIKDALTVLNQKWSDIKQKALTEVEKYMGKTPIVIAAEHLSGNAQILRNQFNETSKAFSAFYLVPDLNHHLMEGLAFPRPTNLVFIMLNSNNYSEKITKRMKLTSDVIMQNNHEVHSVNFESPTIYSDFFTTVVYGAYLTLFLGLLYDQNPAINPYVDWFKKELSK